MFHNQQKFSKKGNYKPKIKSYQLVYLPLPLYFNSLKIEFELLSNKLSSHPEELQY